LLADRPHSHILIKEEIKEALKVLLSFPVFLLFMAKQEAGSLLAVGASAAWS